MALKILKRTGEIPSFKAERPKIQSADEPLKKNHPVSTDRCTTEVDNFNSVVENISTFCCSKEDNRNPARQPTLSSKAG